MKRPRLLRLLPSVVAVSALLLMCKTTDLVHEAYAQAGSPAAAPGQDPVPANKDFAGGEDDQVASPSEVDVMNSLAKRRRELDAREAQLNTQANMIAAAEARVDTKITQLKQLQAQISALLVQRDDAQKAQIATLVKTYSTMKPKDAARIFDSLPDEVLVPVAQQMKSDVLALVLANMNSENAKGLTVKLASKLALPQTADATAPVTVAAAAPAQPVAAAPTPAPEPVRKRVPKKPVAVAAAAPSAVAPAKPVTPAATTPSAATTPPAAGAPATAAPANAPQQSSTPPKS